jgi:signal transduction histidine kinase
MRSMPAANPTASARPLRTVQTDVIEFLAHVLATSEEEGRADDFYGRICEATTRMTSMRRAVIFRYDRARRQVRAAGGYGLDLELFADGFFTVDTAPIARRALEQDNVIEASSGLEDELPPRYLQALGLTQVICAPMVARGRWIGVILADRAGVGAPLDDTERETLWVLGKTAALAAMARVATRQQERALQLEQRLEMARSIHDGVIQRLFGLSLALSSSEPFDAATRKRSARELEMAIRDLRSTVIQPPGQPLPSTSTSFRDELARLTSCHPELGIRCDPQSVAVPEHIEPLAQAVLVEAVRNAQRHAAPDYVSVTTDLTAGSFRMEILNDGARESAAAGAGMGLRVAGFAALQAGGTLEYGYTENGTWRVRLSAPAER